MGTQSAPTGIRETRERQCPHCLSSEVTPTGEVTASIAAVQVAYHCHDCAKGFVLLRSV
jgi:transposase-like protein